MKSPYAITIKDRYSDPQTNYNKIYDLMTGNINMKAPHAITLRDRYHFPKEAYGDLKHTISLEKLFWMEDILDAISPYPTTCDVMPIYPYTFNEIGYNDLWGGLRIYTLSFEINARIIEEAVNDEINNCDDVELPLIRDKYYLTRPTELYKKIIFIPGSNLLHTVDWMQVEKLIHKDPEIMIKPHPIMTNEGLRIIGMKVGFNKIIDPKISGMSLLSHCDEVWGTSNSEIGLRAVMLDKKYSDITSVEYMPNLTMSSVYRLFTGDNKHDIKIIKALLKSKKSGFIIPISDMTEAEFAERAKGFFDLAEKYRELFKPAYPVHIKVLLTPPHQKEK